MKFIYLDCETYLISYPDGIFPNPISLAYSVNDADPEIIHCVLNKNKAKKLFNDWVYDDNVIMVGHNIIFDLQVMLNLFEDPEPLILKLFEKIEKELVRDTIILSKCNHLAYKGSLTGHYFSLAKLANLDEEEKLSPDAWRFNYNKLDRVPINEWPEKALQYALDDITATRSVYTKIKNKSINKPHIHTGATFALSFITKWGIKVDKNGALKILEEDSKKIDQLKRELQEEGYVRASGSKDNKRIQELCSSIGVKEKTDKGSVATDRKVLEKYKDRHPAIEKLLKLSKLSKLVNTFLPQMMYDRIHCNYNSILNTLRTSCRSSNYYKYKGGWYGIRVIRPGDPYPSVNIQQIPGRSDVRNLFIPEEGHLFITIDYANLELICCSQACYNIFGFSDMRDELNKGVNMHTFMGRIIYNDTHNLNISAEEYATLLTKEDESAKLCRKAAKVVNLGVPGGQGTQTMFRLATEQFKLDVNYKQICNWYNLARKQFKEFTKFFGNGYVQPGYIKALHRNTNKAFGYIVKDWGVYLCDKSYTSCANSTLMQTPAALGTKQALIKLVKSCYTKESKLYGCQLKAFIHDEFVLSAPKERIEEIRDEMALIMLESMQDICPDLRVEVDTLVQTGWDKGHGVKKEYHLNPKGKNERKERS